MTQYRGEGAKIDKVATAAITVGDAVQFTDIVGIALISAVTGATVPCAICGEFEVTKTPAAANVFTQGDKVFITGAGAITNVSTSNQLVGYATAAAATGDASVNVVLRAD